MKVKSFVKETIARFKGDDAEVIAQKNYRKAVAAANAQISNQNSKLVDDENALEEAKEKLLNTMFPTTAIANGQDYLKAVRSAQEAVEICEKKVEETANSIAYWKDFVNTIDAEV